MSALEIDDLDAYDEHHRHIIQFLQTMTVPENIPKKRLFCMQATEGQGIAPLGKIHEW